MALTDKVKRIADAIRDRNGTSEPMTLIEMAEAIESMEVADDDTNTYILVDENGNEIPAVLVDEPVMLTANATTDIRKGMTAVTDEGVVTGEKEIPAFHTEEGYKLITAGSPFSISLPLLDMYDFTKLQIIICSFSGSVNTSVAADRIVINDGVYKTNSSDRISTAVKNGASKTIDLGISNTSSSIYLMRYITYKEII